MNKATQIKLFKDVKIGEIFRYQYAYYMRVLEHRLFIKKFNVVHNYYGNCWFADDMLVQICDDQRVALAYFASCPN